MSVLAVFFVLFRMIWFFLGSVDSLVFVFLVLLCICVVLVFLVDCQFLTLINTYDLRYKIRN